MARALLPFLRYMNVERIDVFVASHPHSDHIGGLVALLEAVDVGHYIDSGQSYDSWTARRLRQLIKEKDIRYHRR
jgi:beta-lactamase superfamily II metal-dependent hydrolase